MSGFRGGDDNSNNRAGGVKTADNVVVPASSAFRNSNGNGNDDQDLATLLVSGPLWGVTQHHRGAGGFLVAVQVECIRELMYGGLEANGYRRRRRVGGTVLRLSRHVPSPPN